MSEITTKSVGGTFAGPSGQTCELLYIHLVGGPLNDQLVLSVRADGKLPHRRECITDRGTVATYYPWRPTDASLRPIFRFANEDPLPMHPVFN